MPIYAYKCSTCGFAKDVLQKMSDAPLTRCPECGAETFGKQLTAAGFQLKGSGWYVTDFRDGQGKKADKAKGGDADAAKPADGAKDGAKEGAKDGAKPSADAPAAAPAPATSPAPAPAAAPSSSSSSSSGKSD